MTRLHELSTRFLGDEDLHKILQDVLDAIIAVQRADFGNVLLDSDSNALEIVAHRGFDSDFLQHFSGITEDSAAWGRARHRRERVVIEDVETDPGFAPHRQIAASTGFRAVQSTPLLSRTGRLLGVVSTYFRDAHRPSDAEFRLTDLYARQAADMIEHKLSQAALLAYQQELQDLTTRLIAAQETQSQHLARELHDGLSQRLAVIGMELADMPQGPGRRRNSAFAKVKQEIGALATDIQRMSRHLHPAILDDLGLSAAIKSECFAFADQYRVPAEFASINVPQWIPANIALCLYRIAQEGLRNIAKHAGAASVHVTLRGRPDEVSLVVKDSGIGFDPKEVKRKRGLGLVSMEERVRIVGGTLSITSRPGGGTQIEARAPVHDLDG